MELPDIDKILKDGMAKIKPAPLTKKTFSKAIDYLCDGDPDLAHFLTIVDPPPFWTREPGFASLILIILEQQVSLASARASFDRLLGAVSSLTPKRFLKLDDARLKSCGFSRQKIAYGRNLAQSIVDRHLELSALETRDDPTVRSELVKVKGIGPWTANIYLLTVLRRPDIWPSEDLALAAAVQKLKRLTTRPTPRELEHLSQVWKPWRAVAARLLWHYYIETVSKNRHRGIRSGETPTV
jgi:DNA-3-methyladenine glycosylase II